MPTNEELYYRCLIVEVMVRDMVLRGITDNKKLVEAVDKRFRPESEWEQEMLSEAIIYARQAILN